jgi:hypothetical protein
MIRVKWTDAAHHVHIGTILGIVKNDILTSAVIADDDGPLLELPIDCLINASASPIPAPPTPAPHPHHRQDDHSTLDQRNR